MKYFGREDFAEGGTYPIGFHWGYIYNYGTRWSFAARLRMEHHVCLRIPTPLHMVKMAYGENLYRVHEWTILAFAAWPYKDFPSKFRHRCGHFWSPIYGS